MSQFILSNTVNRNRVFILQRSKIERRIDPFYYVPELVELENSILKKKPNKLRHYVKSIASGATPKTTESEKYYSEKENGIPFLRVQNLSPTGVLEFEDCKYINSETHNGMLKRSQVSEGDLLVKITGVGRMAVASVAPIGFEGNINQHVCVIKTGSREISETVSAFLNTDIGERLASRRSTGGTRPALDYPALLSIPILFDNRILDISKKVIERKRSNECKADILLSGIDKYLFKMLEIDLPTELPNTLKNRMFKTPFVQTSGGRLDAYYYQIAFQNMAISMARSKWQLMPISSITKTIVNGLDARDFTNDGSRYLRVSNIKPNRIDTEDVKYIQIDGIIKDIKLSVGDLLITRKGTFGVCAPVTSEIQDCIISSEIFRLPILIERADPWYLAYFLNSSLGKTIFDREKTGAIMGHITQDVLARIKIPMPPVDIQKEIACRITSIRKEAQALRDQTINELAQASKEIEQLLLGNN